ncbi:sensor histidine kinase [Agaribacter flavus]|uniref:Sensor histidine kinase n=1 Tax=Agaribacter flavus TaxID=1902781 RepID=A0ABV7FR74_9ALTE
MKSRYFYLYQLFGWSIVFASISLSIHFSRGLGEYEVLMAFMLVVTTAAYSCFIRLLYKQRFSASPFAKQVLYFVSQAFIGAFLGAGALVLTILALTFLSLINYVPAEGSRFILFFTIFGGNGLNMLLALFAWSAIYLSVVKARQVYEVKAALSSSQLEVLVQQLNPHFLFNMLNNIRALILEDPARAREALAQLSDMLRYSLEQHQNTKVTVQQEYQMINEYLSLCKIQFEERLHFSANIHDGVEQALIPNMLFQLCVENAIKHGVAKIREGGLIHMEVYPLNDELYISFVNPVNTRQELEGEGQQGALQNTLLNNIDSRLGEKKGGIGLKNMRKRLALLYAKSAESRTSNNTQAVTSLHLDISGNIATVTIRLPLEFKREND